MTLSRCVEHVSQMENDREPKNITRRSGIAGITKIKVILAKL